ncbi:hypothetical protein B0H34DRAFT_136605 [Crassisporium funariophilum]|nr:hypothetical protein B0H34DRAFT_136605 [Crassisporium funariophilum]
MNKEEAFAAADKVQDFEDSARLAVSEREAPASITAEQVFGRNTSFKAKPASFVSRPSWKRSSATATYPSFGTALADVDITSVSHPNAIQDLAQISTPAFVEVPNSNPVASSPALDATAAPVDAKIADNAKPLSVPAHADAICASAAALTSPVRAKIADNDVSITTNTAFSVDMLVFNTTAKSIPTKDKIEEDDFEAVPGRPGYHYYSTPAITQKDIDDANNEDYTQQVLEIPPHMDDHLWGYLRPFNPALPRIDFWELKPRYTIGRSRDVEVNDISFPGPEMSKAHCAFVWNGGEEVLLYDFSRNGTFINGEIIGEGNSCLVHEGDEISFCVLSPRVNVKDYRFIYHHVAGRIPVELAASLTKVTGMDIVDDEEDDEEDFGFSDTNDCLSASRASTPVLSSESNPMDTETNTSQRFTVKGTKRSRDPQDDEESDTARPSKRPNTATHALNPAQLRSTLFSAPSWESIDQPWERGRTRYRQPADTVIGDKTTLPPFISVPTSAQNANVVSSFRSGVFRNSACVKVTDQSPGTLYRNRLKRAHEEMQEDMDLDGRGIRKAFRSLYRS